MFIIIFLLVFILIDQAGRWQPSMHSDAWCFPQLITTTTLRYRTAAIIIAVVSSLRFNNKSSGNRL